MKNIKSFTNFNENSEFDSTLDDSKPYADESLYTGRKPRDKNGKIIYESLYTGRKPRDKNGKIIHESFYTGRKPRDKNGKIIY